MPKSQPSEQSIKRAFVQGFVNTLKQSGVENERSVGLAKKAVAHREKLYAPETQELMQKRASEISEVLLGKASE